MSHIPTSQRDLNGWLQYVREYPQDFQARHDMAALLPRLLAQLDGKEHMMLYRCSRLFAPGSDAQNLLLQQAAKLGNTAAMLNLAQQGLQAQPVKTHTVLHYLRKIFASKDSFIRDETHKLLEAYPQMRSALAGGSGLSNRGFFSSNIRTEDSRKPAVDVPLSASGMAH
ncbi:MAG: hypothetical protein JJT82_06840 [Legionellaceae bacterium]|nr:hypothetical protein [Legionellaceae bacterium]